MWLFIDNYWKHSFDYDGQCDVRNNGDHEVISFDRVDIYGIRWNHHSRTILLISAREYNSLTDTSDSEVDKLSMMQPVHTENNNSALDMESLEEMLRKVT